MSTIHQGSPRFCNLRVTLAPAISSLAGTANSASPVGMMRLWRATRWTSAASESWASRALMAQMSGKKGCEMLRGNESCLLAPSLRTKQLVRYIDLLSHACLIAMFPSAKACHGTIYISFQIRCGKPKQKLRFFQVYQPWTGKIEHSVSQTDPANNSAFKGLTAVWNPPSEYFTHCAVPRPIQFLSCSPFW